jgi:hypothetical protein
LAGSNNTPISSEEIIDRMIFFIVQSLLRINTEQAPKPARAHIIKARFPSRGEN